MLRRLFALLLGGALIVPLANLSPVSASKLIVLDCREGGPCKVGDRGPGGGVVVHDAGVTTWWGRYLEARVVPGAVGVPWAPNEATATQAVFLPGELSQLRQRIRAKGVGFGRLNTTAIVGTYGEGNYAASVAARFRGGGQSDWFLPSKDELDLIYRHLHVGRTPLARLNVAVWTSTEASDSFAWYQLFQDGTQFTDANGIIPGLKMNKVDTQSRAHVGSSFVPTPFQIYALRAFANGPMPPPQDDFSNGSLCAVGGLCRVGDVGPGGGIVFYDAGSRQTWGRFMEVAPASCESSGLAFRPSAQRSVIYPFTAGQSTPKVRRLLAKGVGMGAVNTALIVQRFKQRVMYAARFADESTCNGLTDWFLPSKDELDLVYNVVRARDVPLGDFDKGYYWTSTDYNNVTAWTQYFTDGQQFDRVQTLFANKQPPNRPFRVRMIRAFG